MKSKLSSRRARHLRLCHERDSCGDGCAGAQRGVDIQLPIDLFHALCHTGKPQTLAAVFDIEPTALVGYCHHQAGWRCSQLNVDEIGTTVSERISQSFLRDAIQRDRRQPWEVLWQFAVLDKSDIHATGIARLFTQSLQGGRKTQILQNDRPEPMRNPRDFLDDIARLLAQIFEPCGYCFVSANLL